MSRLIVVGDVHGCLEEFKLLLDKVQPALSDTVVVAGDLVDRGPDSPGVVRFCRDHGILAIQGNHDAKLLRRASHMQKVDTQPGYRNPMRPSEDQEATVRALVSADFQWLSRLPFFMKFPEHNLVVVHAGLLPRVPVERQSREVMTMVRFIDENEHRKMMPFLMPGFRQPPGSVCWTDVYDHKVSVVYGHHVHSLTEPYISTTPTPGVLCYGIDQGCVFGGRLTAAIFETGKEVQFVQVEALKEHYTRETGSE